MAKPIKKTNCIKCKNKGPCFKELNKTELELVDKNRLEVKFNKGEIICKQGSFASHIMYLYEGLIKVYIESNNKNHILNIIPSGQLIGLPSLFNDNIFHYSASSLEDSIVCCIDINIFRELTRHNASFASEIIKVLNEKAIIRYDRFISLSQKHLNGRFADAILYLSHEVYKNNIFKLSLSRKDLAELTGMSVESVIRTIKAFNNDGIIKISNEKIEITNLELLKKISEKG